jgi:hypothetical protein
MGLKQSAWQVAFCLGWIQNPDNSGGSSLGSMSEATLHGSPGFVVYQDSYGGHYRKKIGFPYNVLWNYKSLNRDDAL